MIKKKVLVAMSGGVDSAVAALLLKEQGYDVSGVTMILREHEVQKARFFDDDIIQKTREICDYLDIGHYVLDYRHEFQVAVMNPFIREYAQGRTPNPCVLCNRHIKFGCLLTHAIEKGFDALATGHYAAVIQCGNHRCLVRPKDLKKDQTYFLAYITVDALSKVLFPLASYTKNEVKDMALASGLPLNERKESQDICFIPSGMYHDWMCGHLQNINSGIIVDQKGHELGIHKGIPFYTIGQRGGLGISHPTPLYVLSINAAENKIVVGEKKDLLYRQLIAKDLHFFRAKWPTKVYAKIRYRKKESACCVIFRDHAAHVIFVEEQEAITPGQLIVWYDQGEVLGSGVIEKTVCS